MTLRGMTEEEERENTPEAIERWIAMVESLPVLTTSDEEWAEWKKRRAEEKAWNLKHEAERAERLLEQINRFGSEED